MKTAAIVGLMLLIPVLAIAGHEAQIWTEAGVRYKLSKQLRLKFDQHFRLDDNVTRPESIMPELAVSYRPAKYLRLEAGYRYIIEFIPKEAGIPAGELYANDWHRFQANLILRKRWKPATLQYRLRFQEEFGRVWKDYDRPEVFVTKETLRNRIKTTFRLGKGFRLPASTELFLRLGNPRKDLYKLRLTTGLEYSFGSNELSFRYRVQIYLQDDNWGMFQHKKGDCEHILALGYHFRF